MDFEEFLWARGAGQESIDSLRENFAQRKPLSQSSHEFFFKAFKEYLLCGGLPEAVKAFLEEGDVYKTRDIQSSIYESYKGDMSRYDQEHSLKTRRIYDSLLSYTQNKVKRLRAKQIEGDVRASLVKYEDEIDYLVNDYDSLSILPIEVKSGRTGYEYRALPKFVDPKGNYRLGQGMVLQNANRLDFADNILTAPIYMAVFI